MDENYFSSIIRYKGRYLLLSPLLNSVLLMYQGKTIIVKEKKTISIFTDGMIVL